MSGSKSNLSAAEHTGAFALVRRLMIEQAASQWPRYVYAFLLGALAPASTSYGAYLIGDEINDAYVNKNLRGIIFVGILTAIIFMINASATYLGAVQLSNIGNPIIAENQRRLVRRIIRQNLGFFADRHSSEFLARVTTGANAASQVLNLIFTAFGRDLLSLIGLLGVMIYQDPVMSFFS